MPTLTSPKPVVPESPSTLNLCVTFFQTGRFVLILSPLVSRQTFLLTILFSNVIKQTMPRRL